MREDITKSSPDRTAGAIDEANRRRSERVVLRVPVQLSAKMPGGRLVCIQAQTLVVNAHGGLLDVGMEMFAGQRLLLSKLKTEEVMTGKVLRVQESEEGRFSVAFEFESPSSTFWPVTFPPADWSSPKPAV